MQTENIIDKARRLGLDTGSSDSLQDNLRYIAEQVGLEKFNSITDLDKLESILDEKLKEQREINSVDGSGSENTQNTSVNRPYRRQPGERFGEREYNQAKNKDGVYDKNYYANKEKELAKKEQAAKEEKDRDFKKTDSGPIQADGSNTKHKSIFDKAKDNINLAKAKNDRFQNKLNGAKAKAYNAMHPGEALKNQTKAAVKNATQEVGNKAKSAVTNAGKAAGKAIGGATKSAIQAFITFAAANPIVIGIAVVVALILFLLLLFTATDQATNSNKGFYDPLCDFNQANVNFKSCSSSETRSISLKDYILGVTYAYTNGNEYDEDTIKALMIVIKTNALSRGGYSSSSKTINLDDCSVKYQDTINIPENDYQNLDNLYEDIANYLFVSDSYDYSQSNLAAITSLPFSEETINNLEDADGFYESKLEKVFNVKTDSTSTDTNPEDEGLPTIFVGDSRVEGMNYGHIVNDSNSVYAGGKGYSWFVGNTHPSSDTNSPNGGIAGINALIQSGNRYNIVSWLGANDIYNRATTAAQNYFNKYKELATGEWSNHIIYVAGIGPVDDVKTISITNSMINEFNSVIENLINSSGISNLRYIDLGLAPSDITYYSADGLHYDKTNYQKVYDIMVSKIGGAANVNITRSLYDMSEHCTYYTLTGNNTYWWPIGSKEPTVGNIYGGEPVSVGITSNYGYRVHPVTHQYRLHGGADITATVNTPVIATKDGTVTDTVEGCVVGVTSCGGTYGNHIKIDHGEGISSLYGHLSTVLVKKGDRVQQGQLIGYSGETGRVTGPHLHFEIRINNDPVNPIPDYVSPDNPRPVDKKLEFTSAEQNEGTKKYVCESLLKTGFSNNAVIAIMVNMTQESNFNEHSIGDHGTSYGLCQWHNGRWTNLKNYSPNNWQTAEGQLSYFVHELQTSYSPVYKKLLGNSSARDMATYFCTEFESPAQEEIYCPKRSDNYLTSVTNYVQNGCS